ncbi:MAG TPA: SIMPL domain-containing protein [Mycobacteriales bacterium]|nr:SIMPL domain-containing protein [Mycobacteriales bacterium]
MWTNSKHRIRWAAAVIMAIAAACLAVALVASGGHQAAAATATSDDLVTVSGVGTVQGVPDQLTATFDVHVTRSSVQGVLDAEASSVHRVLSALSRHGINGVHVQTTSLALNQHYDNHGRPDGYDAFETVSAQISPLSRAGAAISAAATASGNDVSVDGLTFDIADDKSLLSQARSQAFADAKDRAQQYAGLTGRSLGQVAKVTEVVQAAAQPYPQRYSADLAAAAAKSVPLRAGEQPVTVNVTVVWRLR